MKKIAILLLLFFTSISITFSQELPKFKDVKLNKKAQFKLAEPVIHQIIDYLLATPIDKKNKERRNAGEFLIRWMNGTKDHTFLVEEKETNFFNTDADLILVYMAALTKFQLANPNVKEQRSLVIGAMQIVLPYLNAQDDKKTWNKELWQLNEANQKGRLEIFLYN